MGIVLVIFLWAVGLNIFYYIMKSAVDNSETAHNIRVIKEILSRQYPMEDIESEDEDPETAINEAISKGDAIEGYCPACHAKISDDAKECPSCGLTLK